MPWVFVHKARLVKPKRLAPLEGRARKMVPLVTLSLKEGFGTFRKRVSSEALQDALKTQNTERLMKTVPWEALPKDLAGAKKRLEEAMTLSAQDALGEIPKAPPALVRRVVSEKLQSFVVNRQNEVVASTRDGTHQAVLRELHKARQQKLTPTEMAHNIRDAIGLNARQAVALANYRTALAQKGLSPDKEAQASPRRQAGLTPDAQAEAVEAYRERLLDARSQMIAETELRFCQNAAQDDAWEAAQEAGLLPEDAGRTWVVDGRPCKELCVPMDGVTVRLGEPWILPDGRAVMTVTESHPGCMCTCVLAFGEA